MRAHSYFTATNASGKLFRICASCGDSYEMELVQETDKDNNVTSEYYGWFPVAEFDGNGKQKQGQRDCLGEKSGDTRNNGGSNGKEATVVRRAG